MEGKYILDPNVGEGKEPVECYELETWGLFMNDPKTRRVAQSERKEGTPWVSTVFLGLDHQFGDGPPLLFETMAFDAEGQEIEMRRCSTWEEAERQHAEVVAELRKSD